MKKRIMLFVLLGLCIGFLSISYHPDHKEVLNNVEGTIYYIADYEGEGAIYKANADLSDITLIYSHIGKSDNIDSTQECIADFRLHEDQNIIEFEAKHRDEWSLYELSLETLEAKYIKEIHPNDEAMIYELPIDYLNLKHGDIEVYEEDASLFIKENNITRCLLKYKGLMRSDIPGMIGYYPEGLSPDNKYLIFGTNHSWTGLKGIFNPDSYKRYIMEISTGHYTEYVDSYRIQWLQ